MCHSKRGWFAGLLVVGLALAWTSTGQAAAPNPFQPNDEFVIAQSGAPLMRGHDTLASVERGQTLRVLKVEGPWVGTAVMVNGRQIGGWIWAGQAVTPQRYAALQRTTRRMYSVAPSSSYGPSGGYSRAPAYGGAYGVLPNQESPNRLIIGDTPYGSAYWRADRKIMGY